MLHSLPAKIILCALVMLGLGGLGSWLTSGSIPNWFADLKHPPGRPPNWIFGPVWSALYLMIGTSFALIWHHDPERIGKTRATYFFSAQLLLNLLWTPAFFGIHQITLALIIIILMWCSIALTILEFRKLSPLAAKLLIPYLLWVSFATYLNAGYAWLN